MKYKFFGQPNQLVTATKKKQLSKEKVRKPLFRFDENGEYICDDERLIERLKAKFAYQAMPDDEPDAMADQIEVKPLKCCKYCDFETESQGALMRHYKTEHPKE